MTANAFFTRPAAASPAREGFDPAAANDVAAERRGALRPSALTSPRARVDAETAERAIRLVEGLMVVALAAITVHLAQPGGLLAATVGSLAPLALSIWVLLGALGALDAYRISRREPLRRSIARACAALLLSGAALYGAVHLLPPGPVGVTAATFWFLGAGLVVTLMHLAWRRRLQRIRAQGRLTPNIVIVGATANAERLIEQARESGDAAVLGVFDDRIGRVPDRIGGVAVLGDTSALLNHRIMPFVDRVVITVPARAQGRVRELIERLRVLPNQVSLFLDIDGEVEPSTLLSRLADAPMAQVSGVRLDASKLLAKRLQDLVVGALALVVAAPIMLLVALAIRLDSPGPIFFRQRRHGFNNEEILVWKFRSMRHDAADATASRQVTADDERVTRVGRFIRRTSLDELPQLFNVLKGEMSLVGPRPHAIGMKTGETESARLVAEYAHRHRMKPGLTGWAAIQGSRGPVATPAEVRRRVALDVEYIERQSFWLDLYIIAMTVPCLIGDRHTVR